MRIHAIHFHEKDATMNHDVFSRTETTDPEISPSQYNVVLGLTVLWGFLVNYAMVRYIDPALVRSIDFRLFLIGYFVLCFLGIYIFKKSTNPLVSFFGYNLVVIPFGFVLNIIISQYDPTLVLDAIQVTGVVTLAMLVLGTLYPAFFASIIRPITIILIITIIVELVLVLFFHRSLEIIDWIVAIVFCGYIGYDWGRANRIPKTVDNAVDSAASIYMDIINLFVRILRIMGRKR